MWVLPPGIHLYNNLSYTTREHQWRTVLSVIIDILTNEARGRVKNYLLQQAVGSGKTMTIACLALMLTKLV
jgi:type I site-specific restriction-modification system R (restriction) subunit